MAKVMISLPDELLAGVDADARRRGTTRSGWLRVAARNALGAATDAEIDALIERAQRIGDSYEVPLDAAKVVRADRDERDARDRHPR
jgi:hypothetical protein